LISDGSRETIGPRDTWVRNKANNGLGVMAPDDDPNVPVSDPWIRASAAKRHDFRPPAGSRTSYQLLV